MNSVQGAKGAVSDSLSSLLLQHEYARKGAEVGFHDWGLQGATLITDIEKVLESVGKGVDYEALTRYIFSKGDTEVMKFLLENFTDIPKISSRDELILFFLYFGVNQDELHNMLVGTVKNLAAICKSFNHGRTNRLFECSIANLPILQSDCDTKQLCAIIEDHLLHQRFDHTETYIYNTAVNKKRKADELNDLGDCDDECFSCETAIADPNDVEILADSYAGSFSEEVSDSELELYLCKDTTSPSVMNLPSCQGANSLMETVPVHHSTKKQKVGKEYSRTRHLSTISPVEFNTNCITSKVLTKDLPGLNIDSLAPITNNTSQTSIKPFQFILRNFKGALIVCEHVSNSETFTKLFNRSRKIIDPKKEKRILFRFKDKRVYGYQTPEIIQASRSDKNFIDVEVHNWQRISIRWMETGHESRYRIVGLEPLKHILKSILSKSGNESNANIEALILSIDGKKLDVNKNYFELGIDETDVIQAVFGSGNSLI
ncbi:hypothetical protein BN7_4128 [Wickerhamomyces ciferrii]|uniref:Uncharacterized protein n=1 Tax=Wickerhamomyces ciferrii (strain ATCC 14091 / BCRC 22168 / CBS 111 / JCM 3599 / NBRC 0793 / NRRL Y-1031 F-60-10) TaxID=1206466 RepID=K0KR34_WICCF|nr:uncharacterized protein BN7_4128 [Wickerhamomyces ciferrii]CCH44562.1 hypothetical protein BN7_4128 [Wickerhamomyces ciferrii]